MCLCVVFADSVVRWDQTVSPALLRLSIGLEAPEDLIADLEQARDRHGKLASCVLHVCGSGVCV